MASGIFSSSSRANLVSRRFFSSPFFCHHSRLVSGGGEVKFCLSSSSSSFRIPSLSVFSPVSSLHHGLQGSRGVATIPVGLYLQPPPPREFNADGTPKKYRLNQKYYNHEYDWERWTMQPAGVFHTVYRGEFAKEYPRWRAFYMSYPVSIQYIMWMLGGWTLATVITVSDNFGIRPKRFTIEWVEAQKERDRAENSNPVTRYIDRRRRERGSHWILADYLPLHPFEMWMVNHHDTELLRSRAESASATKEEEEEEDASGAEEED